MGTSDQRVTPARWDFRAFREIPDPSDQKGIKAPSGRKGIPGLWGLTGRKENVEKKANAVLQANKDLPGCRGHRER